MVLKRSAITIGLKSKAVGNRENLSQNAVRNVNLCFILWGYPLCGMREEEVNSKTFLEFAGVQNFSGKSSSGE